MPSHNSVGFFCSQRELLTQTISNFRMEENHIESRIYQGKANAFKTFGLNRGPEWFARSIERKANNQKVEKLSDSAKKTWHVERSKRKNFLKEYLLRKKADEHI
jgi:hypothetical protein